MIMPRREVTRLTDLRPGESGLVSGLDVDVEASHRLLELGFVEGTPVTLVRYAPIGDPIEFDLAGARFSLRKETARLIAVDRAASTC